MGFCQNQGSVLHARVLTAAEEAEVKALFERWMVKYKKSYGTPAEKEKRFKIFEQNAIKKPAGEPLSPFADWTLEEFARMANGCRRRITLRDMQITISDFLYGSAGRNPNAKKIIS
ncbi:hypothetical protein SSX86_015430 [Deinandra increscens subsp. villosa]|uniref:Cathepsin propeptide inhibitor domain-containing protein n=1 Tax=Deinandra increscens subsp. villosa TaxID=3103831 RepID=A0AAP0GWL7_9ASTR